MGTFGYKSLFSFSITTKSCTSSVSRNRSFQTGYKSTQMYQNFTTVLLLHPLYLAENKMKYFVYSLTGFSTAQLLAFIGAAYPVTSVGISIIYLCLVATSLALGFINWAKGRQLNPHNEAHATIMAAFSGSIVVIGFILITAFAGIYIATGGF